MITKEVKKKLAGILHISDYSWLINKNIPRLEVERLKLIGRYRESLRLFEQSIKHKVLFVNDEQLEYLITLFTAYQIEIYKNVYCKKHETEEQFLVALGKEFDKQYLRIEKWVKEYAYGKIPWLLIDVEYGRFRSEYK